MCSKPNAKTLRFITKKEFICKAAKQGDGEQVPDPPWGIYRISRVVSSMGLRVALLSYGLRALKLSMVFRGIVALMGLSFILRHL